MAIEDKPINADGKLDLSALPAEQLVELYFKVKAVRSDLSKQDKELKEKQDKLEIALGDRCAEMQVDSFKVAGASITRSLTRTPAVNEGEVFLKWAQEHDRMDLVQIKHYATPVKEYLAQPDAELPDGMMFVEKYSVSVRRA